MSEPFEPRNIIVTGGYGFIGSNFVRWVVENHPEALGFVTIPFFDDSASLGFTRLTNTRPNPTSANAPAKPA